MNIFHETTEAHSIIELGQCQINRNINFKYIHVHDTSTIQESFQIKQESGLT